MGTRVKTLVRCQMPQILDLDLTEPPHQLQNQKNFMRWLMQQKHLPRPASCWMMMDSFHEKTIIEEDIKKNRKKSTKSTIILYRKYTKKKKPKTLIKYEKVKIHFSITVPIYHNQSEQNLMNKYF